MLNHQFKVLLRKSLAADVHLHRRFVNDDIIRAIHLAAAAKLRLHSPRLNRVDHADQNASRDVACEIVAVTLGSPAVLLSVEDLIDSSASITGERSLICFT